MEMHAEEARPYVSQKKKTFAHRECLLYNLELGMSSLANIRMGRFEWLLFVFACYYN
jgi:hypothetical protein